MLWLLAIDHDYYACEACKHTEIVNVHECWKGE